MEAIREGMSIRMRKDNKVILFGEDVGAFGGCFGVTAGMFAEFGDERVRDTPISEGAIIGCAVGSAATGLRPIAELMFIDFITVGMDQLVNQAAKMRYMFGGHISMPLVVRVPAGGGVGAAAQHSQSLEAWPAHVPGLKVVYPSTPRDALGLMLSAIDDDNPVVYVEHKALYGIKEDVSDLSPIPLGKGDIKRAGSDVTIIATGKLVHESLSAAQTLEGQGIKCEVLDPRSLYPLDTALIKESLSKTHKVVIATEENKRGSYAGEISAIIAEDFFDLLDAPIIRVGALNCPVPFSPCLEQVMLPNAQDVVNAVKRIA
jgi:pyruvate dehydrogenase E1 component beta subunit